MPVYNSHHHAHEPLIAPSSTLKQLLQKAPFRNYVLGILCSFTAFGLQSLARAWLMNELTGSPLLVSLVQTFAFAPLFLFTIPGGILADWLNRKYVILFSDVIYLLSYIVLLFLVLSNLVQPWHILALAAVNGTTFAVAVASRQTMYSQIVSSTETRTAASTYTLALNLAMVAAPALGVAVLPTLGVASTMIWAIGFLVVGIAFIAIVKLNPKKRDEITHTTIVSDFKQGIKYVYREPALRLVLAMVLVSILTLGPLNALLPVFATDVLNSGSGGYSLLVLGNGIGAIAGALLIALVSKLDFRRYGFVFSGLIVVSALAFAYSTSLPLSLLAIIIRGFAFAAFMSLNLTTTVTLVPASLRGRVMSIRFMLIGTSPIGTFSIGLLGENFGVQYATVVLALVGLGLLLILLFMEYGYLGTRRIMSRP